MWLETEAAMQNNTPNASDTMSPAFKLKCMGMVAEYPLHGAYFYNLITMISFDSICSPITITLNILVISVMCKNPCLRTIPNCILVNLAVSDLLTGLITQPCKAVQTAYFLARTSTCELYVTGLLLGYLFGMVSCLTLALMALERYLAIFRPFLYIKMTVKRAWLYLSIGSIWFLSAIIVAFSFFTPGMALMRIAAIVMIILTITSSAIVYIRAIIVVKNINRRVSSMPDETSCGTSKKREKMSTLAYNGRKLKATKMAGLILLVMIACYIPSCVLTTLRNISKISKDEINGLHDWGQSFVLLNSSLNPIIYCLNLTEMRKKIIGLVQSSVQCKK